MPYDEFLLDIMRRENQCRYNERMKSRIRAAGFPQKKYLEDLIIEDLRSRFGMSPDQMVADET